MTAGAGVRSQDSNTRGQVFDNPFESKRKSYGNMKSKTLEYIHNEKSDAVWDSFGQFVAKNMKLGKGVWIPKFGQFSFTAMTVDLQGSTNPQDRDHQQRFPVFLIARDFVSSNPIKTGISSGMTGEVFSPDGQFGSAQIRQYGGNGVSGIIPKLRLNYYEVAAGTNGTVTKEHCRFHLDQIIKGLSDMVRAGHKVDMKIPHVGQLRIKGGVAGVVFDSQLVEECYGTTVKKYETLFMKNNWMNSKNFEPNLCNYDENNANAALLLSLDGSRNKNMKSMVVSQDGKNWLKKNMDIDYDNAYVNQPQISHKRALTSGRVESATVTPNRHRKIISKQRVMSAARATSEVRSQSRYSAVSTVVSRVPELAPFQLMNLAVDIYGLKKSILDKIQEGLTSVSIRDQLSSSQIQKIIALCGYRVDISYLKALLKELGLQWNGKSCSIHQLLMKLKDYVNPQPVTPKVQQKANIGETSEFVGSPKKREGIDQILKMIKDVFYSTGKSLFQLYRQCCSLGRLDCQGLHNLLGPLGFEERDIQTVFSKYADSEDKESMSYQTFEKIFKLEVPNPGSHAMEVQVIKKVREWMFNKQYPSSGAFERLIRSADRFLEKSLSRTDFHKALISERLILSAAEIDFLFDLMAGTKQEITQDMWLSRIYDDVHNPLQLIREVVQSQDLNVDDILFQMKIKIWDDPIDYNKFEVCIRRLDPSLADSQSKALFQKLKGQDDKVDIQVMLNNISGTVHDTVDYKNKMFKLLYKAIYSRGKNEKLLKDLESHDPKCDGKISPQNLEKVLKNLTGSEFTDEELLKFTRQLQKDDNYKVSYVEFMDRMTALGNREHNPFRTLMQRLAFFLETNKINVLTLIKRLCYGTDQEIISVQKFAEFMQQKIDKKRGFDQLYSHAQYMDIDKDGFIGVEDLKTCLRNLNSIAFFQNGSTALSVSQFNTQTKFFPTTMSQDIPDQKVLEVCKEIRTALGNQKLGLLSVFNKIDSKGLGMINLGQFTRGIVSVVTVSGPILEKLFNIMDTNQIGMIDFNRFSHVIKMQTRNEIPRAGGVIEDSFQWQEMVIAKLREWVKTNQYRATEAFRSFDKDFNGLISKEDMKQSLIEFLDIKPIEITQIRMERLFRVLSFYKCDDIQPSDFERLIHDTNPYETAATGSTKTSFKSSMGGGFSNTSTLDWKFAAIQQIGLTISKSFSSLEDSFRDAAQLTDRVNFGKFETFIVKIQGLQGFNITKGLLEKIFAEMDPHKKTYLTLKDWISCFQMFNQNDQLMVELKNFLQCQFTSSESAYGFFQQVGQSFLINYETFRSAISSLMAQRRLTKAQMRYLFQKIAQEKTQFGLNEFSREFSNVVYSGKQIIPMMQKKGQKTVTIQPHHTSKIAEKEASTWETDMIDKLKRILAKTGKSLEGIFQMFDKDGSGEIDQQEFYKCMKLINIHFTDAEIENLRLRVDANNDGIISYMEFANKFRQDPIYVNRMKKRANNRLALLKQYMVWFMVSPVEAFKMFDSSKEGNISYLDFDKLVRELYKLAKEPIPCYSVIKDLFDTIDVNKDQLIDTDEWNKMFGEVAGTDLKLTVKSTPLTSWTQSLEATKIATCIARSRKQLIDLFKKNSTHRDHNGQSKYVTFQQAKKALTEVLKNTFDEPIPDDKLLCLLQIGQVVQKIVGVPTDIKIFDFMHVLNVYRDRHQGPKFTA